MMMGLSSDHSPVWRRSQSERVEEERTGYGMVIDYIPRGVCSRAFRIEVEDGVIRSVRVTGGCHGNLQGISALLKGMKVEEAIRRMEGIRCGAKSTSCPDQLARALKQAL